MTDWDAFASDGILAEEIKRLVAEYGIRSAVETGTYQGVTTRGLAALVPAVYTIEIDPGRFEDSRQRLADLPNVRQFPGASPDVLPGLIPQIAKPALYYLDAHWDEHYPLPREVEIIAEHDPQPVIVMHDMLVPGHPELHADPQPDGSPYDYEWVRPGLEKIRGPWRHYYNDWGAEGLKIGIMFVVPTAPASGLRPLRALVLLPKLGLHLPGDAVDLLLGERAAVPADLDVDGDRLAVQPVDGRLCCMRRTGALFAAIHQTRPPSSLPFA